MELVPTDAEIAQRRSIVSRILEYTRSDQRIKLPVFDSARERPSDHFALLNVGIEPNDFGGTVGGYRYQFEGEEDLLHMIVTSIDSGSVTTAEAHRVASFVLQGVPTALIWLRPGEFSQHFYVGHDELLKHLIV